jgi:glycosyltransferase involved in cell wall biosynthesis
MRILSVVNSLGFGGLEVQLLQATPHILAAGIEMDFCCTGSRNVLDEQFEALGCEIVYIKKSGNCLAMARRIEGVLASREYAAVHSNFGHTAGGDALGATRAGVPSIVSLHSSDPQSLSAWRDRFGLAQVRNAWLRWHRYLLDRHADVFVGHSRTNLDVFRPEWGDEPSRYRVVLNGTRFPDHLPDRASARKRLGLAADAPVLVHVGSMKIEKNHAGLLEVAARVLKRRPDAQFLCVGDGPLRTRIKALAHELGIAGSVRFEGLQANVWPYYASGDVFVFPSAIEGFGNVLIEAQAAGLPVVASDIAPHREAVAPGQQRFLFRLPDYDAAAELVLEQLEAAAKAVNPWVQEARRFALEGFSIERFANDLVALYRDVAGREIRPRVAA